MQTKIISTTTVCVLFSVTSFSQTATSKQLEAKRTAQAVKIDGNPDESAWKDAAPMTGLIEFRPTVGAAESFENRTETWLMYSDEGIYFGGYCHERNKDSIATELAGRDGFGTNDYIGIILDTYNDKINGFEYFVTPLGEQWDAKMSPGNDNNGGEDFSWNAVWESASIIHNDGWSFEMFIPYSAIRFGKAETQTWGLNITRRRRKSEQQYTWNPIDPNVNGFLTQEGYWSGITSIKPPLRLQFSPYISIYGNNYPSHDPEIKSTTGQANGGLDLKYGINQAFTLDATLIPDFGQVQSDNNVLNLSPFEVKFNENRAFFTEGTELFNKGGLFYSRRIGGTPIHAYDIQLADSDEVVKNPTESKLINASKISGRMQKGLGIAILNAITRPQYATIENTINKEQRSVQTDPLTNYNVFVLDQTLKHNSGISLINTNVLRSGSDYDANVTAALFDLYDKKNTWNLGGKLSASYLSGYPAREQNLTGYSHTFYFGKTSGRFNFNFSQELANTKYNSNDLGYFTNNNYIDHYLYAGYRWTEPRAWYNRIFLNVNARVSNLYAKIGNADTKFQQANFNMNTNIQTKKLYWMGLFLGYSPVQNDFYEPRMQGYYFRRGSAIAFDAWVNSNEAKKFSFYTEIFNRNFLNFYNQRIFKITISPAYRFNNKLSVSYRTELNPAFNSMGYSAVDENDNIIFAKRHINTIENTVSAKYNFNNKMGITFRARHYVSTVENKEFFTLLTNGNLEKNDTYSSNNNQDANFFNVDMVYTWQFAPGSFLNLVWKNATSRFSDEVEKNYFKNFSRTIQSDQNNNISLKIIYFIDYLRLKNALKK